MTKFDNFYDAWWYLNTTDVFWHEKCEDNIPSELFRDENNILFSNKFNCCLDIDVVKVNPDNDTIEDEEALNTKTQIWLECGTPYTYRDLDDHGFYEDNLDVVRYNSHDIDYDCGADTFEEAIIILANLVWGKNGK